MKTLEESKVLQYDHYVRCRDESLKGVIFNPQENEDKSYTELLNELPQTGTFLDVGCQTGVVIRYLENTRKQYEYYGIEILEEVAQMAINNGVPNVSVGYMENMPYPDNFFDIVWARHVLEHSTDLKQVLSEIKRILKPNGILAFIVPCGFHNEPAHLSEFEKTGWIRVINENGYNITKDWQHNFNLNEYCGVAVNSK